jgi:hypothetical protein
MKAYKIMARNGTTRVMTQDLRGIAVTDLREAWLLAEQLARKQCAVTNQAWTAEVEEYTVGYKPGSDVTQ